MTREKDAIALEAKMVTGNIRFDYIKGTQFRVIHVDGAHGGVQPSGKGIHMAMFNERFPVPRSEEFEVEQGKLGKQTEKDQRDAIVREVEIVAIMDLKAAQAIRAWLDRHIAALEVAIKTQEGKGTE